MRVSAIASALSLASSDNAVSGEIPDAPRKPAASPAIAAPAYPEIRFDGSIKRKAALLLPLTPLRDDRPLLKERLADRPNAQPVVEPVFAIAADPPASSDRSRDPIAQSTVVDPDLGVLRLQDPVQLPLQPTPQPQPPVRSSCDLELGCLRLREPPPVPAARNPVVHLSGRVDYFRSGNVFTSLDPVSEGFVKPSLTLYALPALGRDTYFIVSATGSLARYSALPQLSYNELFFRAGILQRLSPTMFGEIGWSNQQLFIGSDKLTRVGLPLGTRFLNEHSIRLELSRRDQLNKRLSLSSFYQFRYGFSDPIDRSRLTNLLNLSLSYDLKPTLQLGLDYQIATAHFTSQSRTDLYNQVLGRVTLTAFRNTQFNVFAGYAFGSSSDRRINFDGLLLGVSVSATLGLF